MKKRWSLFYNRALIVICSLCIANTAMAQAGRRARPEGERAATLNVVVTREGESGMAAAVTARDITLYDDGIEQTIQSFTLDPSPARIVLLVDNSATVRADLPTLQRAVREFVYEIYEGDQLMIVGYDEQPEIISEWNDDAARIEPTLANIRKRGDPHLFDALRAVINEALRPLTGAATKLAVVIVGDGLDRGSRTRYEAVLAELQSLDIAVYALQLPDRTGGALRRDSPKPADVIQGLTEGTSGRALPFAEARASAATICTELRRSRYVLAYSPFNVTFGSARRLLLIGADNIALRYRMIQPSR